MNAKKMMIAAAVALMLLVGAGVAYASGSSGDSSSGQSPGPGMDRAKSVALEQVNGRVTGSEFQDEEGYYEVEVTKADGTQVDSTSIRTSTSSMRSLMVEGPTFRTDPTTATTAAEADPTSTERARANSFVAGEGPGRDTLALPYGLIHRSAWKANSPKLA